MLIDTTDARLRLLPGEVTRLALGPQTRLAGVAGQAWITFDNDRRDIVLGPGDTFVSDGAASALACALRGEGQAAELRVTAARA